MVTHAYLYYQIYSYRQNIEIKAQKIPIGKDSIKNNGGFALALFGKSQLIQLLSKIGNFNSISFQTLASTY